ncbi:hypothetical protein ACLOJK_016819 [Asimina triloba]
MVVGGLGSRRVAAEEDGGAVELERVVQSIEGLRRNEAPREKYVRALERRRRDQRRRWAELLLRHESPLTLCFPHLPFDSALLLIGEAGSTAAGIQLRAARATSRVRTVDPDANVAATDSIHGDFKSPRRTGAGHKLPQQSNLWPCVTHVSKIKKKRELTVHDHSGGEPDEHLRWGSTAIPTESLTRLDWFRYAERCMAQVLSEMKITSPVQVQEGSRRLAIFGRKKRRRRPPAGDTTGSSSGCVPKFWIRRLRSSEDAPGRMICVRSVRFARGSFRWVGADSGVVDVPCLHSFIPPLVHSLLVGRRKDHLSALPFSTVDWTSIPVESLNDWRSQIPTDGSVLFFSSFKSN